MFFRTYEYALYVLDVVHKRAAGKAIINTPLLRLLLRLNSTRCFYQGEIFSIEIIPIQVC